MKIRTMLTVLSVLTILSLSACDKDNSKQVEHKDLLHHNFVLSAIDDNPFTGERIPHLEFGEGMHISGAICNNYMGQAELQNNTLTVANMASTRMICNDKVLDELEISMSKMLLTGAKVTLNGNILTLEDSDQKLTFTLKDAMN